MFKKYASFLFIALLILASSCSKDGEGEVALSIAPSYNNTPFELNKVYTNHMDQYVKYELVKFYLSNIELVDENDEVHPLADVILYDFADPTSIIANVAEGNYKALNFAIGLDSTTNATDPNSNSLDVEHPLSYAQGTHWGWASKYKFVMLHGRIDTEPREATELFEKSFAYDTGFDELYREVSLTQNFTVEKDGNLDLQLNLNMDQIFNKTHSIDMFEVNQSHSLTEVAEQISDNIALCFDLTE